jgi:hypothetical protein
MLETQTTRNELGILTHVFIPWWWQKMHIGGGEGLLSSEDKQQWGCIWGRWISDPEA